MGENNTNPARTADVGECQVMVKVFLTQNQVTPKDVDEGRGGSKTGPPK